MLEQSTSENAVKNLVGKIRSDHQFRRDFLAAPAEALRQRGIDPAAIALPETADIEALEARLRSLASIEPDGDVWEGLKEILADPDGPGDQPPVVVVGGGPVVPVIAIYGVSVVVTTPDQPNPSDTAQLAAALKKLRALARSEPHTLKFSVHGPDGELADGLSRDVLEAFLARLN